MDEAFPTHFAYLLTVEKWTVGVRPGILHEGAKFSIWSGY